jgi:hypothetical protein
MLVASTISNRTVGGRQVMTPKETLAEGITAGKVKEALDLIVYASNLIPSLSEPIEEWPSYSTGGNSLKECQSQRDKMVEDLITIKNKLGAIMKALSLPPSKAEAQAKALMELFAAVDEFDRGTELPKAVREVLLGSVHRRFQACKKAGLP